MKTNEVTQALLSYYSEKRDKGERFEGMLANKIKLENSIPDNPPKEVYVIWSIRAVDHTAVHCPSEVYFDTADEAKTFIECIKTTPIDKHLGQFLCQKGLGYMISKNIMKNELMYYLDDPIILKQVI